MKLDKLLKTNKIANKRLGRGIGSGKGKTSGRGTKGQKARGKVPAGFIGGTLPIYRKLPFRRGLGNSKRSTKMIPVSISKISSLAKNTEVDLQILINQGLVTQSQAVKFGVKIVSGGEVDRALIIKLPITAGAAQKIEKAGGKIG